MKTKILLLLMVPLAAALCLGFPGCPPTIKDIDPGMAREGDPVRILGSNLGDVQGDSTLTFNGVDAGAAGSWNSTEIVVNVPEGATSGPVVATVGGQPSPDYPFTVLDPGLCDSFQGGDFDFEITGIEGDCLPWWLWSLLMEGFKEIDLSFLNGVPVPATSELPMEFDLEIPIAGEIRYEVDLGEENCWVGSGGASEPITIDLSELTGGVINCTIVVVPTVLVTMDPVTADQILIALSMEVDSIEGELCPIQAQEGCSFSMEVEGTLAEPS